jgi:hypothetical protein
VTLDDTAFALDALREVTRLVHEATRGKRLRGTGTTTCPKCHGLITFTWEKRSAGSRPLSYVAWCATQDCIRFSGH